MSGKARSLYNIVNGMRYFGVGSKVTRNIYQFPDTYWVITKVKLSKDQEHGNVYGRLVWRGKAKNYDMKRNLLLLALVAIPFVSCKKYKANLVPKKY